LNRKVLKKAFQTNLRKSYKIIFGTKCFFGKKIRKENFEENFLNKLEQKVIHKFLLKKLIKKVVGKNREKHACKVFGRHQRGKVVKEAFGRKFTKRFGIENVCRIRVKKLFFRE
jgi:hypothetical protein